MADLNVWRFDITDTGKADLDRLDDVIRRRALEKLKWFVENFQNIAPLPLSNRWRGFFKLRLGEWRIVYEIQYDSRHIVVHAIDKRDKIYKERMP